MPRVSAVVNTEIDDYCQESGRWWLRLRAAPPVVVVNRAFARRFFPGEPDARILDRPQLKMPVRSLNREGVSIADYDIHRHPVRGRT